LSTYWIWLQKNAVDLTGTNQHGFKKERGTVTAALTIQSLIVRKLYKHNYFVLASLSLGFNVVDRPLLQKEWRT
jgi:hypothetical protein